MAGRGKKKRKPGGQFQPPQDPAMPLKSMMQEAFVANILKGMPQYQAYIAAGYKTKNPKQIIANASRLKASESVLARFEHLRREIEQKTHAKLELNAEEILAEIKKVAFANIDDYATVDSDGHIQLRPFSTVTRDQKAAIQKLRLKRTVRKGKDNEEIETATTEFDLYNKLTACAELLDRIQGKARQAVDVRGVIVNRQLSDEEMAQVVQEPERTECEDAIAH